MSVMNVDKCDPAQRYLSGTVWWAWTSFQCRTSVAADGCEVVWQVTAPLSFTNCIFLDGMIFQLVIQSNGYGVSDGASDSLARLLCCHLHAVHNAIFTGACSCGLLGFPQLCFGSLHIELSSFTQTTSVKCLLNNVFKQWWCWGISVACMRHLGKDRHYWRLMCQSNHPSSKAE